ncbi:PQQ enzyme repeat protein [Planctomycetes bacterium MalM25]|nr:PQQ enzyme repeat protein [Planctomycetes bacterium MalM25]
MANMGIRRSRPLPRALTQSQGPARVAFRGPIFLSVFSALFALTSPLKGADTPPEAYSRLFFALQPPQDRDSERSVELIEELLESDRFGEAAPLIDRVFAAEIDHLDSAGESLRRRLLESVLGIETRGRGVIRSILEGVYRRRLSEATSADRLERIVSRYPPELFGGGALSLLAREHEKAGAYAKAAAVWRYAEEVARSDNRNAQADRYAEAAVVSGVRSNQLDADALPGRLRDAVGSARDSYSRRQAPASWVGPGGDLRRRARGGGAAPLGWPAWQASVEPSALNSSDRRYASPTGGLVATRGMLLAPTPTGLVAFSAASGKRLWRAGGSSNRSVKERLSAYDRSRGGVATDGRLAFVVEPTAHTDARRRATDRGLLFTGSRTRTMPANALVAYDLAREGVLAWRWDGGADPDGFGKAALLGPPAVAESRLYALAEIDQSVCVLTFDTDRGEVLASQPLVRCERGFPPHALMVGVTPTVGQRLLYCPTGRGAVAAYDPLLRRLEWVHYLEVEKDQATPRRRNLWNGLGHRGPDEGEAWKHCRLLKHGDRLVVVSPALATLEVLDAASGALLWREPLETGRYLAGVEGERVVTLEESAAVARDLDSGDTVWRAEWPEGDTPSGEAVWLDSGCLVPLRSGALAHVDNGGLNRISLDRNPLERPVSTGGLIVHRGSVYSRSHEEIACFRQPLRGAEASPSDLALQDLIAGDREGAVRRLREELEQRPGDKRLAERLAAASLLGGGLGVAEAKALRRQVSGPTATAYAAYAQLEAALRDDDPQAIHKLSSELQAAPLADESLAIEPGLWVRADRLAAERVGRFAIKPRAIEPPAEDHASWSLVQIEAAKRLIEQEKVPRQISSRRRESAGTFQPLRFPPEARGGATLGEWAVELRNGEPTRLIAHNRWGERAFSALAPSSSSTRGRRPRQTLGLPSDALWGDWIALRLDEGYAVYRHTESSPDGEAGLVWTSPSLKDHGVGRSAAPTLPEQLFAAGPWGVISVAGDSVRCRDLATGRLQWRRRLDALGNETPRLLVSGGDLLIAGAGGKGTRLSAATGELRPGPWNHPPPKSWRAKAVSPGGATHLLVESRAAGGRAYRLASVDAPDVPLWSSAPGAPALTTSTPEGLFALLDEDHRFTLVDLKEGRERFTVSLASDDDRPVRGLRIEQQGDRLLVEVDRTNQMIDRAVGVSGLAGRPMLTGELHCLDPRSGEPLWAGPAKIEALSRLPIPFRSSPVLLYGRRTTPDSESPDTEPRLSLVVVDLGTGGTRYRDHAIPAGDPARPTTRFRVQREAGGRLLIRAGRMWLRLSPTDRPAPPRPPMLARVEDPASSQPKDVGRSVERLFNSFWDDP